MRQRLKLITSKGYWASRISFSLYKKYYLLPNFISEWIASIIVDDDFIELINEIQTKSSLNQKDNIESRFDSRYQPPFRVGRKQGKAVLDANGHEVIFFKESQDQAKRYCDYLNGY